MTAQGGKLFAVQKSTLYRVNPSNGVYESLGSAWSGTAAMCAAGDQLYICPEIHPVPRQPEQR